MKIGIVTRPNEGQWGGDLKALYAIRDGLISIGHEVKTGPKAKDLLDCQFIFLSNTCHDQRDNALVCLHNKILYAVIGFHEDFLYYYPSCVGFFRYIKGIIDGEIIDKLPFSLELLCKSPNIIKYFGDVSSIPKSALVNIEVLEKAKFCIANSQTEANTMHRDSPLANVKVVPWDVGISNLNASEYYDEFLKLVGFKKGEYLLQVGRLETRKNQIATVLASRNLDIPLVFISTKGYQKQYNELFFKTIFKYRKAPTIIVSEDYKSQIYKNIQIIQMPNGKKLSETMLISAYQNCGLHVHPAFWELPGYTYLEAAKLNVPTIASSWGSLQDYCKLNKKYKLDPELWDEMDGRIQYVEPFNVPQIEEKIKENFGKKCDPNYSHPIFNRTNLDTSKEIDEILKSL